MSMKAKDEFSGLTGPRPGHHHPGYTSMEVEGDGSSQKLPKCHLVGSREKKLMRENWVRDAAFYKHALVHKVSLLEMLDPDRVPSQQVRVSIHIHTLL